MQTKPKIRYSRQDKLRLQKLQQRVNSRIYYQRSKGGDTSHLPQTIKIKDLEDNIYSRQDYNFQISQLNKMLEKDAMDRVELKSGKEVTKGYVDTLSNMKRRENIKRAYKRKRQAEIDAEQGKLLGSEQSASYQKRDFDILDDTTRHYKQNIKNMKKMYSDQYDYEKALMMRENYIKSIYTLYTSQDEDGKYVRDSEVEELVKVVEGLDPIRFVKLQREDDRFSLEYNYQLFYKGVNQIDVLTELWKRV